MVAVDFVVAVARGDRDIVAFNVVDEVVALARVDRNVVAVIVFAGHQVVAAVVVAGVGYGVVAAQREDDHVVLVVAEAVRAIGAANDIACQVNQLLC